MKQFLPFTLIGLSSGLVNMLVYNITLLALQLFGLPCEFDCLIALFFGFLVSVGWSFMMNRKFTFTSEAERSVPWKRALLKTYISYAFTGFFLSYLLSLMWYHWFHIPREFYTIINDVLCFPITFLLTKYWSFRKR